MFAQLPVPNRLPVKSPVNDPLNDPVLLRKVSTLWAVKISAGVLGWVGFVP